MKIKDDVFEIDKMASLKCDKLKYNNIKIEQKVAIQVSLCL